MADNVTPSDDEMKSSIPHLADDEAMLIMPERQSQSYEEPSLNAETTSVVSEQASTRQPLLMMRGINKSFGAVRALTNVDFEVYAGEVVGLVGDNGAGKSTLIKTIAGVGPADEGEIFVEGQPVKITSPQGATRLGIETVYQDLALCDNLDVVANLFLGREDITPLRSLRENEMERKGLSVLRTLEVKIPS